MIRSAVATASALVFVCSLAAAPGAFAQASKTPAATPATGKPAAPPAPAKWIPPIKGTANIEVVAGQARKVGDEIVSVLKVKNISTGSIALLKLDEYWYNKKREIVSAGTISVKKPINPGEVVEITAKAPYKTDIDPALPPQYMFSHANGQIKAKGVKKFSE